MPRYQKVFLTLLLILLALPFSASAFWFWPKTAPVPAATTTASISVAPLDAAGQAAADAKYKLWDEAFEKRNVDSVIANQNNFYFTVPELNYIFATETKKLKKPVLTDFFLNDDNGALSISANFHQIVRGHLTFNAQVTNDDGRAHLNVSKLRLYGIPMPSGWLKKPLNDAIDKYFAFLYKDARFKSLDFTDQNGVLKLKPEFK